MILRAQRRHARYCRYYGTEVITENLNKCECPCVVSGTNPRTGTSYDKMALHTLDRFIAQQKVRELEETGIIKPPEEQYTIEEAFDRYTMILTNRRRKEGTHANYRTLYNSLQEFADGHRPKIKLLREITFAHLTDWIGTWELKDSTSAYRQRVVKKLFKDAFQMRWIPENPAFLLEPPKGDESGQTMPFDLDGELPKIREALPHWWSKRTNRRGIWSFHPDTAIGLVTLLDVTGMRWSEACVFDPKDPHKLRKVKIGGQDIYCYFARQKKTGHMAFTPLKPEQADLILNCKWLSSKYPFWNGRTGTNEWNHRFVGGCLRHLEEVSGVPHIRPHRFRDSFAVDLLSRGVDIRTVSRLLGHKSVKNTLDHYEHYIKSDQDKLLTTLLGAWAMEKPRKLKNVVEFPAAG